MIIYTDTQTLPPPANPESVSVNFATFKAALKAHLEANCPKGLALADAITWAINWAYAPPRGLVVTPAKARAAIEKCMSDWHPAPVEP